MTTNLTKEVATEIMGWTTRVFKETNQFCYGEGGNPWALRMNVDQFSPETNPAHLEMVTERMLELGFSFLIREDLGDYRITMTHITGLAKNICSDRKDWPKPQLITYLEAFRKLKTDGIL